MTGTVVAGLITAGGAVLAAVITVLAKRSRDQARGGIEAPTQGQELPRKFLAVVKLASVPRNRHVWLATRTDELIFPKEPEIPSKDLRWAHEVFEGGDALRFSLALILVNRKGQREILGWFSEGARTNNYPGLTSISGSIQLDIIPNLRLLERTESEKAERENEHAVITALRNLQPGMQYRTAEGIAEEVGITVNEVRSILTRHPGEVRVSRLPDRKGRVLYQFRERSVRAN